MPIFTNPTDYILASIDAYPTLYAAENYDFSRRKVMDQLLNVIGNGIRDDEELVEHLLYNAYDKERAFLLCNGTKVFIGYTEVEDRDNGLTIPVFETAAYYLEHEKDAHPEVKYWVQSQPSLFEERDGNKWTPYCNFGKNYSTVWRTDYKSLGRDWCDEAIWFYEECLRFFAKNESHYHYAFPKFEGAMDKAHGKTNEKYVNNMLEQRAKYNSDEEFSIAYGGVEYTGDMEDFLIRKWAKEKAEIIEFINETIEYLKN